MERAYDVLGLGLVAVDDILFVERYPAPDSKVRLLAEERQCGGLTGTALVAASRLGARCAYAGTLGTDELSSFVARRLEEEGVSLEHVSRREGAAPVHSTIIVDLSAKTRTILFSVSGIVGAPPDAPPESAIRSAGVLFVDQGGVEGMVRAARIAKDAKIPVVADLERDEHPRFGELLSLVDHLIVSRDFACRLTGEPNPMKAALALFGEGRDTVVVTAGETGAFWVTASHPRRVHRQPSFPVEVVDTTGCGDVFHGAYAAALARGADPDERVEFAAAAAALKARAPGGQRGIPHREVVEAYLRSQG